MYKLYIGIKGTFNSNTSKINASIFCLNLVNMSLIAFLKKIHKIKIDKETMYFTLL